MLTTIQQPESQTGMSTFKLHVDYLWLNLILAAASASLGSFNVLRTLQICHRMHLFIVNSPHEHKEQFCITVINE